MVDKLYRIFSGVWLGSIVFFSGVIAPQIFRHLQREHAANLQNQLFPYYYMVSAVCGALLFALSFVRGRKRIWWIALGITLSIIGLTVMSPLIREAYLSQSPSMKILHPVAVGLNILMLLCVLVVI